MERRIFAVLVLMAAVAAYSSDRSVQQVRAGEWRHVSSVETFGPVCYPGDPCGWPGIFQGPLNGPVCYPGDPCGPRPGAQGVVQRDAGSAERLNGPMCMPGDPCGPGTIAVGSTMNFSGPMCFPGDPCGPGGVRIHSARDAWGAAKFNGPMCMPGDPCGPGRS